MTAPVAPPPSYPGTVKVFDEYKDGDVIWSASGTEWTGEIDAIEDTLGVNPQIDYSSIDRGTVSGRLTFLERDTVRLEGNQLIHGTKEFADTLQIDGFLIGNGADVKYKFPDRQFHYTDAGLQQLDGGGVTKDLTLQPTGGQVFRGGFKMWDAGNDGPNSGLDADTLDGFQATDFLLKQGIQVGMTADQTILPHTVSGDSFAWTALNLNTVVYEVNPGDGNNMWKTVAGLPAFYVPSTGLYVMEGFCSWIGPWEGSRNFRVVNANFVPTTNTFTTNFTTFFNEDTKEGADVGPARWPTNNFFGNPTDLVLTPNGRTALLYLIAGTVMRVDVYNWSDHLVNATVNHDGYTHIHRATTFTLAQIA